MGSCWSSPTRTRPISLTPVQGIPSSVGACWVLVGLCKPRPDPRFSLPSADFHTVRVLGWVLVCCSQATVCQTSHSRPRISLRGMCLMRFLLLLTNAVSAHTRTPVQGFRMSAGGRLGSCWLLASKRQTARNAPVHKASTLVNAFHGRAATQRLATTPPHLAARTDSLPRLHRSTRPSPARPARTANRKCAVCERR